jgi:carboxymethylenebutenolidase
MTRLEEARREAERRLEESRRAAEERLADVRAAVEYLRSPAGGSCTEIFTVGFCFGGRCSWLAAAGGHGLAGAIGFYGSTVERNGAPGPT